MDKSIEILKEWARAHLTWFGQSAFRLRTDEGRVVFFDPYHVPASAGPADLILVTHPHGDHYDRAAIAGLRTGGTVIVLPASCAAQGETGVAPGQTVQLSIGPVKAVAAYNVQKRFHPKSGAWVGYLVQVDGVAFYHAGDTDAVPEMEGLRPDVALVPIGGLFAMDWRQGAHAVELLRSTLSIPMHYSMLLGGRRAGQRFCEKVGAGSLVLPRG